MTINLNNTLLLGMVAFKNQSYWATLQLRGTSGEYRDPSYLNERDGSSLEILGQVQRILKELENSSTDIESVEELRGGKVVYKNGKQEHLTEKTADFWKQFMDAITSPNLLQQPYPRLPPIEGNYQVVLPKILQKLNQDKPLDDEETKLLTAFLEKEPCSESRLQSAQLQLLLTNHLNHGSKHPHSREGVIDDNLSSH